MAAVHCSWPRAASGSEALLGALEAEKQRWYRVCLSWEDGWGEVKTVVKFQLSPFCCVTWDKSCMIQSLHSVNDFNHLGMARFLDEGPWFPYLQNGGGDPTCQSCWQPQG